MKKTIINELLNQFEINFIERHIVYSFLQNKKIDYKKSPIILKYLSDFEANPLLLKLTEALKITELKLLENYL